MDYRSEFADFEDVTYLNMATQGPIPLASARAAHAAVDCKKLPHTIPEEGYFGLPDRIRELLAKILHADAAEFALTTGASSGLIAIAHAIEWAPGDEVLLARGEFPAHPATWRPLESAGRLKVVTVEPRGRFVDADDFIARITPRTRLISASLVRFDNAARLDAPKLAAACRAAGAFLLLDISQCAGAVPMNLKELGADFAVCAGYKWLLGPYGTGFLWARAGVMDSLRPGPLYWMAVEGARNFHSLGMDTALPVPGARRWDAAETGNFFNLAAMEKSLEFVLRVGVEQVWHHNNALLAQLAASLPRDRCVLASPAPAEQRGPYLCFQARRPDATSQLYVRLRDAGVLTGLRENAIRVAPYLFNTPRDLDRLISIVSV